MKDNHPEDTYLYEVLVETGPLSSHATTSKVEFILSGDCDETDIRCLNDPDRELFKKGAIDSFLMSTPYPLGDLNYLRNWQDTTGLGGMGSWYLLSISVQDIQTGVITKFVADQWLAIDRGDFEAGILNKFHVDIKKSTSFFSFQDDITMHALSEEEQVSAMYALKNTGAKKLADDHLWWSVFSKPIRSRFTRTQRVSLCMAMLMLSMLANAMFYGTHPDRVTDGYFSFGMLSFDPYDVSLNFHPLLNI